jgi:hypothetical protein
MMSHFLVLFKPRGDICSVELQELFPLNRKAISANNHSSFFLQEPIDLRSQK